MGGEAVTVALVAAIVVVAFLIGLVAGEHNRPRKPKPPTVMDELAAKRAAVKVLRHDPEHWFDVDWHEPKGVDPE